MSFESKIPEHLHELEIKLKLAESEATEMYHHCNCEYCDENGQLKEEYTEEDVERANLDATDLEETIARLKRFAARHHLDPKTGRPLQEPAPSA